MKSRMVMIAMIMCETDLEQDECNEYYAYYDVDDDNNDNMMF